MDIQRAVQGKTLDISEKGRTQDGRVISLDRRLFMQFMAFGRAPALEDVPPVETGLLTKALEEAGVQGVLYEDINDPSGMGLLTFSENPDDFLTKTRSALKTNPFASLRLKPEYTMLGRTYSIGYEEDLERVLITRPIQRVTDPGLPWAIWYPVRRSGAFERLPPEEQRTILMEHGGIGRAYGSADLAYDIRLACFGLDKNDNDFVIGLLGHELYPLSNIVERMRKTKQTSQYLTNLGPFFVGKVAWQSKQVFT
jgi:chlorite dismutase